MDENVAFEAFLYGNGGESITNDLEFWADRVIMFPSLRPFQLDKAVRVCVEYYKFQGFLLRLLEKSEKCPVLIYRLYQRDIFVFSEIEPILLRINSLVFSYYFRKEINDFDSYILSQRKQPDTDASFFEKENDIDQLIEYGFVPSTIEFCMKYDDYEALMNYDISMHKYAKWSPFEWSCKPKYLDLLSFSGFFGSIKCFKHIMMNGFQINSDVMSSVVCSGSLDLIHLCENNLFLTPECAFHASEFCHLSLLCFMLENGIEINSRDIFILICVLIYLPFIGPLRRVISALLNI